MEILTNTPSYVWLILIFLVIRGLNASKSHEVNIPRMITVPAVFLIWGITNIFHNFNYKGLSIGTYIVFLILGSLIGLAIYKKTRKVYEQEGKIFISGTYIPLFIIVINFLMKYSLNVVTKINPMLYSMMNFNIIYSAASGVMVGLLVGGIYQVITFLKHKDK